MESASNLVVSETGDSTLLGRRLHYRQKLSTLAYVNVDHGNGGIIRDLSESGMAIQAVVPLRLHQEVHLRFDLLRPRLHVEGSGRIAWADKRGQAGVQFLNFPVRARRSLKQWIFTQLLARARQFARTGFIFASSRSAEGADELLFSSTPRPVIHLDPQENRPQISDEKGLPQVCKRSWFPSAISPRWLCRLVDCIILFAAVLLFFTLAMRLTHSLPSLSVTIALVLGITAIFAGLYWFLFGVWTGATPGQRFVQFACGDSIAGTEEEERPRFR